MRNIIYFVLLLVMSACTTYRKTQGVETHDTLRVVTHDTIVIHKAVKDSTANVVYITDTLIIKDSVVVTITDSGTFKEKYKDTYKGKGSVLNVTRVVNDSVNNYNSTNKDVKTSKDKVVTITKEHIPMWAKICAVIALGVIIFLVYLLYYCNKKVN